MRPNASHLVLRDAALAAALGAIDGVDFGSDFGIEDDEGYPNQPTHRDPNFAGEYGYEFGGYEFGADDAYNLGYEFGVDAAPMAKVPPPGAAAALWQQHQQKMATTRARDRLLQPNKGSDVKVERYVFAINQTVTLGVPVALVMTGNPDTNIRPQRVSINAPACGFATVNEIKVANVSVSVGGILDAFDFNPQGVGQSLDMPLLTPANRASVLGNYTGFVPPGFVGGTSYIMSASFKGPASIVA